eukprot:jgi/Picsp_1/1752/NSC_05224-R1_---NA---
MLLRNEMALYLQRGTTLMVYVMTLTVFQMPFYHVVSSSVDAAAQAQACTFGSLLACVAVNGRHLRA